jgi:Choline/Carnitine o-acyltransferase
MADLAHLADAAAVPGLDGATDSAAVRADSHDSRDSAADSASASDASREGSFDVAGMGNSLPQNSPSTGTQLLRRLSSLFSSGGGQQARRHPRPHAGNAGLAQSAPVFLREFAPDPSSPAAAASARSASSGLGGDSQSDAGSLHRVPSASSLAGRDVRSVFGWTDFDEQEASPYASASASPALSAASSSSNIERSQQQQEQQEQASSPETSPEAPQRPPVSDDGDAGKTQAMDTQMQMQTQTQGGPSAPAPQPSGDNPKLMPLMAKQGAIPRLPVPSLEATCARYLRSLAALLSPGELVRSTMAVDAFLAPGGDGSKLQALLCERAADPQRASWLEAFWDDGYLRSRDPVPINVNYFFALEDDPALAAARERSEGKGGGGGGEGEGGEEGEENNANSNTHGFNPMLERAAALVRGLLQTKTEIDAPLVQIDTERGTPLDMSQWPRVFCTSRVPGKDRDSITMYAPAARPADVLDGGTVAAVVECDPDHIVVLCRDRFFKVRVLRRSNSNSSNTGGGGEEEGGRGEQNAPPLVPESVAYIRAALGVCHAMAQPPPEREEEEGEEEEGKSATQNIANNSSNDNSSSSANPLSPGTPRKEGAWLAESSFLRAREESEASVTNDAFPVGIFTTCERTDWFRARSRLLELDPRHASHLVDIQSAIFVVCLDDKCETQSLDELSRLILHGTGTNRWFDKHQLIVDAGGRAGMNFEHSVGDGATTLRLADEMYRYANSVLSGDDPDPDPHSREYTESNVDVTELVWNIPAKSALAKGMRPRLESFAMRILEVDTATLTFTEYGGNLIKEVAQLSPDGFVQVAMQLAYFRLFGRVDATYEAASTRAFLHGRTETVRSTSAETVAFVHAAMGPIFPLDHANANASVDNYTPRQLVLLREAVNAHVAYMRSAKQGHGVDRHLYVLRLLAESRGFDPIPEIFLDPAFARSSRWSLSTSHCGSPALSLFGFGPVVPEGLGIGYMIKGSSMAFNVTSLHGHTTLSRVFCSCLKQCLVQLHSIILAAPQNLQKPSVSMAFTHPTSTALSQR